MQPRVALRALNTLIANPDDTAQVFVIIRALSGNSLVRGFKRFRQMPLGQTILREQRDLIDVLKDRERMHAFPAGTLGHAYHSFIQTEQLTADGLVAASMNDDPDTQVQDPDLERYATRIRDMHDLWHTVTEYGRDEIGELCLLAFTYAQTRNRGIGVIVLMGAYNIHRALGRGVLRSVSRAFRAGRKARWLPGEDWEALLEQPIGEVRRHLRIDEPIAYQALLDNLAYQPSR